MILALAFDILLVLSCVYAVACGDRDGRIMALICIAASLVSHLILRGNATRYSGVEFEVMIVDIITLIGFMAVALNSSRFWPLWIAGLQLTTLFAHVSKEVAIGLVPQVYATAAVFWSYPILLILAAGTWRARRRRWFSHQG